MGRMTNKNHPLFSYLIGGMIDKTPVLIKVECRDARTPRNSKPRVYVSGDCITPSWEHPPYGAIGKDPDVDKAWKKYNREEIRLQRLVLKAAGFNGGFSRKAGCFCGCSPGFIVESGAPFMRGDKLTIELEVFLFNKAR